MSEELKERIEREVQVLGDQRLFLTLASSGLEVWCSHSGWRGTFPLPVGRDKDWEAVRAAIDSIHAEAKERARRENAFQQLVDPIDGPDGEA